MNSAHTRPGDQDFSHTVLLPWHQSSHTRHRHGQGGRHPRPASRLKWTAGYDVRTAGSHTGAAESTTRSWTESQGWHCDRLHGNVLSINQPTEATQRETVRTQPLAVTTSLYKIPETPSFHNVHAAAEQPMTSLCSVPHPKPLGPCFESLLFLAVHRALVGRPSTASPPQLLPLFQDVLWNSDPLCSSLRPAGLAMSSPLPSCATAASEDRLEVGTSLAEDNPTWNHAWLDSTLADFGWRWREEGQRAGNPTSRASLGLGGHSPQNSREGS